MSEFTSVAHVVFLSIFFCLVAFYRTRQLLPVSVCCSTAQSMYFSILGSLNSLFFGTFWALLLCVFSDFPRQQQTSGVTLPCHDSRRTSRPRSRLVDRCRITLKIDCCASRALRVMKANGSVMSLFPPLLCDIITADESRVWTYVLLSPRRQPTVCWYTVLMCLYTAGPREVTKTPRVSELLDLRWDRSTV